MTGDYVFPSNKTGGEIKGFTKLVKRLIEDADTPKCTMHDLRSTAHSYNDEFLDELRKLGRVEGNGIVIERKDPDYQLDRIPALAAELVRSKPDLIVTFTPQAAAKLGFQLDVIELREAGEVPGAIAVAKARGAVALFVMGDAIFSIPPNWVPDLARQPGLPSIYFISDFARAGGLISYGPSFPGIARLLLHRVSPDSARY